MPVTMLLIITSCPKISDGPCPRCSLMETRQSDFFIQDGTGTEEGVKDGVTAATVSTLATGAPQGI